MYLTYPPRVTKLCPCPMKFEVLTAMAKTGGRYCHWEDPAFPFFRIEKTFKPKYQVVWSHIPEDASHYV
jgi:hypothetical protein